MSQKKVQKIYFLRNILEVKTEVDLEKKPVPIIEMSEEEKAKILMSNKRFTFWDLFHDESVLNKVIFNIHGLDKEFS